VNPGLELNLRKCLSLPSVSAVAIEVLQRCQADDLNFNEMAQLIGRDPALAVKILKMANSPSFNLRNEVRSISQALGILGLNCVRTVVLSFYLVRYSAEERQGPLASFWKRAVISSIAARELCDGLNQQIEQEVFLAGLFQDLGVMAFARVFGSRYRDLHTQPGLSHDGLRAAELAEFGADHAEVGAWLLANWGVPSRLVRLVRHSHDSRLLMGEDGELFAMARRVEYSGRIADLWSGSYKMSVQIAEAEATALFGEGQIDIALLGSRTLASVTAIAPLFQLKLDEEEMAGVLEQAKEEISASVMRLQASVDPSRKVALRDALTGLYNRGSLDAHLRHRFSSPRLERMGVLFADIDQFARINDTQGYAAGDALIRSVGRHLGATARAGDFVGRYESEKFLMVVELDGEDDILVIAERLRTAVEQTRHSLSMGGSASITISIGCAMARPGGHRDYSDLVNEANQALCTAKRDGRNRVVRAAAPAYFASEPVIEATA
jgi:diguanylate cyclase (GGDEF)-like protein